MQGDVDILAAKDGFKMTFRKSRMALSMRAPDWRVVYANLDTHLYYECKPEDWKVSPSVFSALVRPSSPTSLRLTTSKFGKIKGVDTMLFKMETKEQSRGSDKTWKRLMPKQGEIWLYRAPDYPRQALVMITNFLGLPYSPGVPVAMHFTRTDDVDIEELHLYGVENRQVTNLDFQPPKGFKRVNNQTEVLSKGFESKDFADFLNEK